MRLLQLLTLALLTTVAKADTIVLDETTSPLTISGSNRLTNLSCFTRPFIGIGCTVDLLAPSGATLSGTDLFPPGDEQGVAEPGPQFAEDAFLGNNFFFGNPSIHLTFFDNVPPFIGPTACPDGCTITEDGTFQTMGTITWSDGTVDTIQFHGEAVPEPSSLALFATGLIGIGVSVKRKITS